MYIYIYTYVSNASLVYTSRFRHLVPVFLASRHGLKELLRGSGLWGFSRWYA